jgi:hypothetical protein
MELVERTSSQWRVTVESVGQYQLNNGWVLDTVTGRLWVYKKYGDNPGLMEPVPYHVPGGGLSPTPVVGTTAAAPPYVQLK